MADRTSKVIYSLNDDAILPNHRKNSSIVCMKETLSEEEKQKEREFVAIKTSEYLSQGRIINEMGAFCDIPKISVPYYLIKYSRPQIKQYYLYIDKGLSREEAIKKISGRKRYVNKK